MAELSVDQIIRRLGEKEIEILQHRTELEKAMTRIMELEKALENKEPKIFPKPVLKEEK